MFVINGPEIVSAHYGESEEALRDVFVAAEKAAPSVSPNLRRVTCKPVRRREFSHDERSRSSFDPSKGTANLDLNVLASVLPIPLCRCFCFVISIAYMPIEITKQKLPAPRSRWVCPPCTVPICLKVDSR